MHDEMTPVTKDQFFAYLKMDPRDIMPNNARPEYTTWETPNRTVIGRTLPGWRESGNPNNPKSYALMPQAAASVQS